MNQAMGLYESHWLKTKQTHKDLQAIEAVCTCLAEDFDAQDGKGYQFPDGSKLILTSDNVQVSLF